MPSSIVPQGADHAPALHALVRKRADLAGELERVHARGRELQHAIAHVDAVLAILHPDVQIDLIRPKRRRPPHAAGYGEVTSVIIDCLREAETPLTSRELAQAVVEARELDEQDRALEVLMAKRVRACLRGHRVAGRVRALELPDAPQGWVLVGGRVDRLLRSGETTSGMLAGSPYVQL